MVATNKGKQTTALSVEDSSPAVMRIISYSFNLEGWMKGK